MASSTVLFLAFFFSEGWSAISDVNVYDEPMTPCGPNHGAGCTYAAYDAGAHQVCVTQLPHGFSSDTGQGPWSDEFQGQPWCICIWAYSNYILQNKDLPLKCDSIPSNVLEEQYSLDKFKQCGSMSSTAGCGAEDIRRSIQSLCTQCDEQAAGDPTKKSSLKAKCDAILASAKHAPMSRLYNEKNKHSVQVTTDTLGSGQQVGWVSTCAFGALAFIVAGVLFAMISPLLRQSNAEPVVPEDIE